MGFKDRWPLPPPAGPRRARHYHDAQPTWHHPEPPVDLAHWVLAELNIEPTPASLTLAGYFASFFELDKPRQGPQWSEDGTRLGIQRKSRYFQLGRMTDHGFWTEALPTVPEARDISSPACLYVNSTHIWYNGLYHIGVRRDHRAERGHRLLVCRYTKRSGWHHRGPHQGIRDDSLVLALARGVVDPRRALATHRHETRTTRATGYVGPTGHRIIANRDCPECNARPDATIGAAGCGWPLEYRTAP